MDLSARKAIYARAETKMGKHGVSSGFECEEWNRCTGCELKMGLAVDLSSREGIYTQSESESRK